MASLQNLTVDITARVVVSDDTAQRCLRLLEMWQADNPDKVIVGEHEYADKVVFRIVQNGGGNDG